MTDEIPQTELTIPSESPIPESLLTTIELPVTMKDSTVTEELNAPPHPAVSLIKEIEAHLANIPAFGYSEQQIRKLVASLKDLF